MKKLITLLLALTMCLSLCAPALAKLDWDTADEKFTLTTDMDDYKDAYVKESGRHYTKNHPEGLNMSHRILGSDSKITFTNTGVDDDYFVFLQCTVFPKSSLGWSEGNETLSLRKGGYFLSEAVDDNWNEDPAPAGLTAEQKTAWENDGLMKLKAGESYTFNASALAGRNGTIDPDALYFVQMIQYFPKEGSGIYLASFFQINDTKAAEIKPAATIEPAEEGNPFTDVPQDAYYHDAVLWAVENGVTKGMTPTTFEPKSTCIRAQVVTFLWRAMGCPEPTTTENPFTDVKEADYFYKAVLWAVENGITKGMTDTTFGPNDTCTSGHVITFLWRACGKPAAENDGASWYSEAVAWAEGQKLLEGTDTAFAPENLAPRGDIVTYLYRALKK